MPLKKLIKDEAWYYNHRHKIINHSFKLSMKLSDYLLLFTLGAIWGSSFLFMRIAIPAFGPEIFAFSRVLIAAIFLGIVSFFNKERLNIKSYWLEYFVIAFFNSALPFLMFGIASQKLNASTMSILNATTPVFGFAISILIGKAKLSFKAIFGMVICIFGVFIISAKSSFGNGNDEFVYILSALIASCCYGVASNYIKYSKSAHKISSFEVAYGSMVVSAILLAPMLLVPVLGHRDIVPNLHAILAVLSVGILCSGVAYSIYFKLIKDVGPTSALTVTFLLPIFGTLWGVVFLSEKFTQNTLLGLIIILTGVGLVTNFSLKIFLLKKSSKR
jgi:drug/metabolite transporter (DMT)-like permease